MLALVFLSAWSPTSLRTQMNRNLESSRSPTLRLAQQFFPSRVELMSSSKPWDSPPPQMASVTSSMVVTLGLSTKATRQFRKHMSQLRLRKCQPRKEKSTCSLSSSRLSTRPCKPRNKLSRMRQQDFRRLIVKRRQLRRLRHPRQTNLNLVQTCMSSNLP